MLYGTDCASDVTCTYWTIEETVEFDDDLSSLEICVDGYPGAWHSAHDFEGLKFY